MLPVRIGRYPIRPYQPLRNSLLGWRHVRGSEQLELDPRQPALAAVPLGEGDERAADPDAALIGRRDQHPELARVVRDVVQPQAAGDAARPRGDGDLARADQRAELRRRGARRPVAPEPALRRRVDVVDETGQAIEEPCVVDDLRLQQANDRRRRPLRVRVHAPRIHLTIERRNT